MERTLVDGVPVLWSPAPGPLTAGLVLGVGRRDEDVVRGGVTHLVEHLAMRSLGRTTLDCNATVDTAATQFTATGSPEQVAGFLRAICSALADLPTDGLAAEAGVLRAEAGMPAPPAVGALMTELYGAQGAGLSGFREPALHSITADHVRAWARTRFVRGNAALWLTGPPPPGVSLPLPDGPSPERTPSPARELTLPTLVEIGPEGLVALGAEAPYGVAVTETARPPAHDPREVAGGISRRIHLKLRVDHPVEAPPRRGNANGRPAVRTGRRTCERGATPPGTSGCWSARRPARPAGRGSGPASG